MEMMTHNLRMTQVARTPSSNPWHKQVHRSVLLLQCCHYTHLLIVSHIRITMLCITELLIIVFFSKITTYHFAAVVSWICPRGSTPGGQRVSPYTVRIIRCASVQPTYVAHTQRHAVQTGVYSEPLVRGNERHLSIRIKVSTEKRVVLGLALASTVRVRYVCSYTVEWDPGFTSFIRTYGSRSRERLP